MIEIQLNDGKIIESFVFMITVNNVEIQTNIEEKEKATTEKPVEKESE
jgi:hypothetical protein